MGKMFVFDSEAGLQFSKPFTIRFFITQLEYHFSTRNWRCTRLTANGTIKFYSHQLMHFFIQLCISLLSYIKIT